MDEFWLVFKIVLCVAPLYLFVQAFLKAKTMAATTKLTGSQIQGENILYVIAHPDDEAMFFVPSIKELRKENKLYMLCLSNGGYDGLGKIREKELVKSCKYLDFAEEPTQIDDPGLADGPKSDWPAALIADKIERFFASHPDQEFKRIVTFDNRGVSSHPNHISTYHGCI